MKLSRRAAVVPAAVAAAADGAAARVLQQPCLARVGVADPRCAIAAGAALHFRELKPPERAHSQSGTEVTVAENSINVKCWCG